VLNACKNISPQFPLTK
jgi:hypothetical protein